MKKRIQIDIRNRSVKNDQINYPIKADSEEYYNKLDEVINGAWDLIAGCKNTTEGLLVMHLLDGTRMPEATRAMIGSMIDAAVFEQEEINVECDETNN